MEDVTFYEKRLEVERKLLAYVHDVPLDSAELSKHVEDYYAGGMANTKKHYNFFCDKFIGGNKDKPSVFRVAPFFETTWLLLSLGADDKPKGYAVTDLVRFFDEKYNGSLAHGYKDRYTQACKQGNALSYRRFWDVITAARKNKPMPLLQVDSYRKLICMLAQRSTENRDHTLWTEATKVVTPNLNSLMHYFTPEEMAKDNRLRMNAVGNIGTVTEPVYVPFITLNIPALLGVLDIALRNRFNETPKCRAARAIKLPLLNAYATYMVAITESKKAPAEISPAAHLAKLLEVVENRRRKRA